LHYRRSLVCARLENHYSDEILNVKHFFTLLSKLLWYVSKCFTMRAMRVIVRVIVFDQIARTKCRARPTFWRDAGNEGNQFQTL
jgi:hypothetical protein